MRVPFAAAVFLLALALAPLRSQTPSDLPQFRAGVELLQLDVTVLDDKRQPVRGLAASDFTVLENGVARPIRAFTPIELPPRVDATETAWSTSVPPDIATNTVGEQDGRLVVILMDRSIPIEMPTLVARKVAAKIVDTLGPQDLGAVVSTKNGSVHGATVQNFTADRARLLRAIDAGDPSTQLSPEAKEIWARVFGGPPDPLAEPSCLCGLCMLETITRVADAVEHAPRRHKMLFFIGSNIIWQSMKKTAAMRGAPACETAIEDARNALFAAVDRANLRVHAIDPQGVVNIGPQTRGSSLNGVDLPNKSAPQMRLEKQQQEMNELLTGHESIRLLPARTGGRAITANNTPEMLVPDIFRESEAYYVLGIERDPADRDPRTRTIEVKVGRKGLHVHTQRKYRPPLQSGEPLSSKQTLTPLQESLLHVLPGGPRLALAVSTSAGRDGARALVQTNVDAGAFARDGAAAVPLDVVVLAVDRTGAAVASARQTSTISGRPEAVAATEVNVSSHLELQPGEYGVRVALADKTSGRVGSVFADVTVPDFARDPLTVSSLNVEAVDGSAGPASLTTRRLFRRSESVRAVMQIYQGTLRTDPLAPVSVRVQILNAKGAAIRDAVMPFEPVMFTERRAECLITLPIANLAAGAYLLKIEASLDRRTAGRAVRFAVQ